jgi:hypothetical protein
VREMPPLPRPHRAPRKLRLTLSHHDRRLMLHRSGCGDQARIANANAEVGNASWMHLFGAIFGDPNAALKYMPCNTARVIQFPERRSELAKLRGEIAEMSRILAVGAV